MSHSLRADLIFIAQKRAFGRRVRKRIEEGQKPARDGSDEGRLQRYRARLEIGKASAGLEDFLDERGKLFTFVNIFGTSSILAWEGATSDSLWLKGPETFPLSVLIPRPMWTPRNRKNFGQTRKIFRASLGKDHICPHFQRISDFGISAPNEATMDWC